MNNTDYPALYVAASKASKTAQDNVLLVYKVNTALLVIAAILNLFSVHSSSFAILCAVIFIGSLLAFIYGRTQDFQGRWYKARALAESIKTATWRLMMNAEPFNDLDKQKNLDKFSDLLKELLIENKGICSQLSGASASMPQITTKITAVIDMAYEQKRDMYLEKRIKDQRDWYATKSTMNYKSSKFYFNALCAVYGLAVLLLLTRIANPDINYLPIDVLAVLASGIVGWTQIKRFDELTSSYNLTAYEIGIIEGRFLSVKDSEHLSQFVRDAENAFSREHTQWAARRDA